MPKPYEQIDDHATECFLLAGRIMMENGAETYRAEDTMLRMAHSQNMSEAQSYVTPTGIMFSPGIGKPTRVTSIATRTTDLHKIALVNKVSRKLTANIITLEDACEELKIIQNTNYFLPIYVQILAASVASFCLLILFGGSWLDAPSAFVAGGVGYLIAIVVENKTRVRFFAEFLASVLITTLAITSVHLGLGTELDKIIIGSVMPLVPGLLITNAVRDIMVGHFLSGMSRGAEALLTASAIGSGVALVLSF